MEQLKRLIREIHRRSLWQVLAVYVGASWVVFEVVQTVTEGLGLPPWLPAFAALLLLIGLPIVLATAFVQEGISPTRGQDPTLIPTAEREPKATPVEVEGARRVFTWRNAIAGGVLALALWGLVAAGWLLFSGRPAAESRATGELDHRTVAVFPFRVAVADTALAYLGEGIVDLLALKLTGEGGLRATDPRAALSAWRSVAAPRGEVSQEEMLEAARSLRAAQVLDGGIIGSPDRLILNASVFDVGGGGLETRATVEGPEDSLTVLVDRLTARILAGAAGEAERLPTLEAIPLAALRAYLAGQSEYRSGNYRDAVRHFTGALEVDSTFGMAALYLREALEWVVGQPTGVSGAEAVALAWAARDGLSPRDRAWLRAKAGPRYPSLASQAERLGAAEDFVRLAPDRPEAWYQLGDLLFHYGMLLGLDRPHERAADAFREAARLDSMYGAPLHHLAWVEARLGDLSGAERAAARFLALDSTSDFAGGLRWYIAHSVRDTAAMLEMRDRLSEMSWTSLLWALATATSDGVGLSGLDALRAEARRRERTRGAQRQRLRYEYALALNRGRPGAAQRAAGQYDRIGAPFPPRWLVLDALYWDGDSAAAEAALRDLASRADGALAENPADRADQYADLCAVAQWNLWQGDVRSGEEALARLQTPDTLLADGAALSKNLCATMIEAMLGSLDERSGADRALARLDSLVATGPPISTSLQTAANLVCAHLFALRGEPEKALAAARRRQYLTGWSRTPLSTHLREEARLAVLAGDREGAIRAYRHYLALRADPEPALVPEVERVREELARLIGEAEADGGN